MQLFIVFDLSETSMFLNALQMKLKTLARAFGLMAFLQIISYSCGCESFYIAFRLAEEGSCVLKGLGQDARNVRLGGVMDTIDADSIQAIFQVEPGTLEKIPIASLTGFGSVAHATPPCDHYYEAQDTITGIEIVTVDSLGTLGPGASILGAYGWTENRIDDIKKEYVAGFGKGIEISMTLPKLPGERLLALKMNVQTTLDTIEVESQPIFWK